MRISAIYKIQSQIKPERVYIGSAINIKGRWNQHLYSLRNNGHNNKLQRHYNKYGESDLVFIIIEPCLPEFLTIREQYHIDTQNPYFNILKIAGSSLGYKHTEETRITLKLIRKTQEPITEETRKKMSESAKGHPNYLLKHSEETKEKISNANSGEKNYWFGKHLPEEVRKKISLKTKGHSYGFQKGNQLSLGKKMSDETKQKLSISKKGKPTWSKGKHQSLKAIEKSRLKRTGAKRTNEMKKAMSNACKLAWIKKKTA